MKEQLKISEKSKQLKGGDDECGEGEDVNGASGQTEKLGRMRNIGAGADVVVIAAGLGRATSVQKAWLSSLARLQRTSRNASDAEEPRDSISRSGRQRCCMKFSNQKDRTEGSTKPGQIQSPEDSTKAAALVPSSALPAAESMIHYVDDSMATAPRP